MKDEMIIPVRGDNLVHDESQFSGYAFSASFPTCAQEVSRIVEACRAAGETITIHGSLTAMNGAGVPLGGHCMSTQKLCRVSYDAQTQTVWAETGATFQAIEQAVRRDSDMTREFPAAPTEKTATLGGALSFETKGLRSLRYGSVSDFVTELEYCDSKGSLHRLRRGEACFDLLLGSEGMCVVLTGARLSTVPLAASVWGLLFFFAADDAAAAFAAQAGNLACVSAMEYYDRRCFALAEEYKSSLSAISGLPAFPAGQHAAVYLELESDREDEIETAAETLLTHAESCGGDPDMTWTAVGDEIVLLRDLHHAVSECLNMKTAQHHALDSRVKKLSYPIYLTNGTQKDILRYYRDIAGNTGLDYLLFGHFGERQILCLHLLPHDSETYRKGKELLKKLCCDDTRNGCLALRKCGIGKLYRELYCATAPIDELNKRIKAKLRFDPEKMFNPGNMFTETVL